MKLSKAYQCLFNELRDDRYLTWTVYEYFIERNASPHIDKVNVIVRIDVDDGLQLCDLLSSILRQKGINASFYFLTHPNRYYNIWESKIPKIVKERGFEIGLHTDHYYEELVFGKNALQEIKKDVARLSELVGEHIKGMVSHGHSGIHSLGKRNWDIYRNILPHDLGLVYHDFTVGMGPQKYQKFHFYHISDYQSGVVNAWKYLPQYPVQKLKRLKRGDVAVIFMHPSNAFEMSKKITLNFKHFLWIRLRYQLIDPLIKGESARLYFYNMLPKALRKRFRNLILR